MNDPKYALTWSSGTSGNSAAGELSDHLWGPGELTMIGEPSAPDPTGPLISLAFIRDALRRRAWLWCAFAVLGLVIGSGLFVKFPPAFHAQTSVLLVGDSNEDPSVEILTDQSLAESQPVAALAVKNLGLQQSVGSFRAASTVTVVTDQVLMIDVGAPSSAAAVQRASALANAFLQYRAQYARARQQQLAAGLDQQYNAAEQRLHELDRQISQLPSVDLTSTQKTQLDNLQTQQDEQKQTMQYVTSTEAAGKSTTNAMVSGSYVLDHATAVTQSHFKGVGVYVLGGLFGGLVIGMAIVIISAIMSDRLRRRDDIAYAFGAPVKLSVGPLKESRLPGLRRRAASRESDMRRVVDHLRGVMESNSRMSAGLAVVAVDDPATVARVVAELAVSNARLRKQVVLADLSAGAHAAHLLRAEIPGITTVSHEGLNIAVVVPPAEDVAPIGPLRVRASSNGFSGPDESLSALCTGADLLISLITLDPALGADHLGTWATDAVAVVTAGQSTGLRVHAGAEMIRLAGTHLDSVVVLDADTRDESVGMTSPAYQPVS